MSKEEIKNIFGIDITSKCREELYVFLRAIYSNKRRLVDKVRLQTIGDELTITHASVMNSLKKYECYKKDAMFKLVCKAFETKDKEIIKKYLDMNEKRIKEMNNEGARVFYKKKMKKEEIKDIEITPELIARFEALPKLGLFKVIEKLRQHNNSALWDVVFTKWHYKHWNAFYNLK